MNRALTTCLDVIGKDASKQRAFSKSVDQLLSGETKTFSMDGITVNRNGDSFQAKHDESGHVVNFTATAERVVFSEEPVELEEVGNIQVGDTVYFELQGEKMKGEVIKMDATTCQIDVDTDYNDIGIQGVSVDQKKCFKDESKVFADTEQVETPETPAEVTTDPSPTADAPDEEVPATVSEPGTAADETPEMVLDEPRTESMKTFSEGKVLCSGPDGKKFYCDEKMYNEMTDQYDEVIGDMKEYSDAPAGVETATLPAEDVAGMTEDEICDKFRSMDGYGELITCKLVGDNYVGYFLAGEAKAMSEEEETPSEEAPVEETPAVEETVEVVDETPTEVPTEEAPVEEEKPMSEEEEPSDDTPSEEEEEVPSEESPKATVEEEEEEEEVPAINPEAESEESKTFSVDPTKTDAGTKKLFSDIAKGLKNKF